MLTVDPILIVGQRPRPTTEEGLDRVVAQLGSGTAPPVASPSAGGEAWRSTQRKDAAADDSPAHVPQAVAQGSPFAPPGPEQRELVPDPPPPPYQPEHADRGNGFFFGLGCGLTPGCGPVHHLAVDTGFVKSGSEDLRLGNALGQIVGGALLTAFGAGGDVVGGGAVTTGVGAPAGVMVVVSASSLLVAGEANVTAGLAALSQVLQSQGGGGGKKLDPAEIAAPPAKRGNAPTGADGNPVELHHRGQQPGSPLDEMTQTDHRGKGNFNKNHNNTGQKPSEIDRSQWRQQQRDYWKREWDSGRFKDE
jgi:hypothetical protein